MIFIMTILISLNVLVLSLFNPLAMGVTIIFQALLLAVLSSLFMPSFWFSYILILVYLGGLLVLFIYVASLASNEQMNFSSTPIIIILTSLILAFFATPDLFSVFPLSTDNFNVSESYTWMFSSSSILMTGALMIYLFIALVAVVKITKWWGGSLRPDSRY